MKPGVVGGRKAGARSRRPKGDAVGVAVEDALVGKNLGESGGKGFGDLGGFGGGEDEGRS